MNLIDLLFPAQCPVCRGEGHFWCAPSAATTLWPRCAACGQPAHPGQARPGCRRWIPLVAVGGYQDQDLRALIHRWKYDGYHALSRDWGTALGQEINRLRTGPVGLAPIPLHWTRRLRRGFNQAAVLAGQISRESKLPVRDVLRRTRAVAPQAQVRPDERAAVSGSMRATRPARAGELLWLIDDVYTTGATLAEARRAVQAAGWAVAGAAVIAVAH